MNQHQNEDDPINSTNRATIIGYLTQQHDELQQKIHNLVVVYNLQLDKFIELCYDHPKIKEQYGLIHELFQRKDLIQDIIRCLFIPSLIMKKYGINEQQARKYLDVIKQFLTDNNQFYQHFYLALHHHTLDLNIWFQFLDNKEQLCSTSLANLNDIFIPIVKYQYSSSSRIWQFFLKQNNQHSILILNYFNVELIDKLISFTHYQAVFQVLFNLVIASLEEQQWQISLLILQKLFQSSIRHQTQKSMTLQTHIESMYSMLAQVSNNITKYKHKTIFAFTSAINHSKLISCCINSLHLMIKVHLTGDLYYQLNEKIKENIQYSIKCISQIINIYQLLRKNGIDYQTQMMVKMKMNIMYLFHEIPQLLPLLQSNQQKSLNMSNGENIKAVCLYKYQFFNLIKNSLQLIKDYGNNHDLLLNDQKVQILDLSIKYLTEYRWNNILHCVLQKIICLTISRQIFKHKSPTIHKMFDHLIQSFINKKFLFLNSMRMTNQGNLHSIYNVSCLISLELQKAHTFYDITNPYVEWNSFMKTLEKYEQKYKKYKQSEFITEQQLYQSQKNDKYDLKVSIDELVSIKQIIEKRQTYTKWKRRDKQQNKQKDINRLNNSAKNHKSRDKLISKQPHRQKYIRKSLQYTPNLYIKKLSSSDGFVKQTIKKIESEYQLNQFNETKSDIDLINKQ